MFIVLKMKFYKSPQKVDINILYFSPPDDSTSVSKT